MPALTYFELWWTVRVWSPWFQQITTYQARMYSVGRYAFRENCWLAVLCLLLCESQFFDARSCTWSAFSYSISENMWLKCVKSNCGWNKWMHRVQPKSWDHTWLRRSVIGLSPRRPEFAPGLVRVGFVMDKVAVRQDFLRVLRFSPVHGIHRGSSCSSPRRWTIDPPVGGCISEI
jgi:hypothetical protein